VLVVTAPVVGETGQGGGHAGGWVHAVCCQGGVAAAGSRQFGQLSLCTVTLNSRLLDCMTPERWPSGSGRHKMEVAYVCVRGTCAVPMLSKGV